MPSAGAWAKGQRIAEETIKQHLSSSNGQYPETIAVTLWGKIFYQLMLSII